MVRCRAAAATHEIQSILLDETLQPIREFLGSERVAGLAVDQLRKACVRETPDKDRKH
jgi:hypothetical protein